MFSFVQFLKAMKKFLLGILITGLFSACEVNEEPQEQSQMVLYIIDYSSNEFEGGTILNFEKIDINYSEIDVDIDEDAPENGLDGAVSIIYEPTGDKIFEGGLNDEGTTNIRYPSLISSDQYYVVDDVVPTPSVQDIGDSYSNNFNPIWGSVNQLGLSQIFIDNSAMVGRYLYKPNSLNSDNWKWIILLLDQ